MQKSKSLNIFFKLSLVKLHLCYSIVVLILLQNLVLVNEKAEILGLK